VYALAPGQRTESVSALMTPGSRDHAAVSIGISRGDNTGFRNVNGAFTYDGRWNYAAARFPLGWTDTGVWKIRQLAVTQNGITEVRMVPAARRHPDDVREARSHTVGPADGHDLSGLGGQDLGQRHTQGLFDHRHPGAVEVRPTDRDPGPQARHRES